MSILSMIEVLAAVLILGAGIFLYRRKPAKGEGGEGDVDHYGNQGAVLLFVVAVIIAIHGLGGLEYRPSASELEMAKGLAGMGQH